MHMTLEIELEPVVCNLCGSNEYDPYLERMDLYTSLPGVFKMVRCRNCGLIYENPRPTANSWDAIYPPSYGQYNPSAQTQKLLSRLSRIYGLRKRARFIQRYKKSGSLLDVGCATGDFLEVMANQPGWKVAGIEPHPEASAYARSLGLDVQTGTLDDLKSDDLRFDVITMWHVIEHLFDPTASLEIINQHLQPGGIVILTTPNLDSLDARLFGRFWTGFELPRHLFLFSTQSMRDLLERTGFQMKDMHCFYGTHAAFMSSVRFWLRRNGKRRERLENAFFTLPARIAFAPFFYLSDLFKWSSPVTFVGMKKPKDGV